MTASSTRIDPNRLLNDPDNAEMYRSIALVSVDWRGHTEKVHDTIEFEEETT